MVPPPPSGCDHVWQRSSEVSNISPTILLLWDVCATCGKYQYVKETTEHVG
jgi:hypothetical protein